MNTRKLVNLVKAINPVEDCFLLDKYDIVSFSVVSIIILKEKEFLKQIAGLHFLFVQIKIPCFQEGDGECPVGHYFVMSVNLKKKRFELLDSLGWAGAEQHFVNTADVFKEIWKEAYKQSNGKLSPENLDEFSYQKPKVIPLQGET
jgi:hypothetical protein